MCSPQILSHTNPLAHRFTPLPQINSLSLNLLEFQSRRSSSFLLVVVCSRPQEQTHHRCRFIHSIQILAQQQNSSFPFSVFAQNQLPPFCGLCYDYTAARTSEGISAGSREERGRRDNKGDVVMKGETAAGGSCSRNISFGVDFSIHTQAAFCWTTQEADDTILPLHPTSDKITLCLPVIHRRGGQATSSSSASKSGHRPQKRKESTNERNEIDGEKTESSGNTAHSLAEYQEQDRIQCSQKGKREQARRGQQVTRDPVIGFTADSIEGTHCVSSLVLPPEGAGCS